MIVGTPEDVIVKGAADIAVVATNSFTKDVFDKLKFVMERGINVITTAEEMAYPAAREVEGQPLAGLGVLDVVAIGPQALGHRDVI